MLDTVKYLAGVAGPSGFGSRTTADHVAEAAGDLRSITAVITGATSGIGAETARALAKRGARLVLPARNLKSAEEAKARILSDAPKSDIIVMALDLSSLSSVRRFASEFDSLKLPLNLLINNAGKFAHEHAISEDGFEMTFATNYLGHFLLTKLLVNKMAETARETGIPGRIVNVSSSIHGWFSGDMLRYVAQISRTKSQYDATRAYAVSKLANVLHAKELAERLKKMEANVTVNSVHPGIVRTRLTREREGFLTGACLVNAKLCCWVGLMVKWVRHENANDLAFLLSSKLLKTIPQAAATTCYVATHPRVAKISGKYFADCNEARTSTLGSTLTEAARLWAASELMVSSTHHHSKLLFDPLNDSSQYIPNNKTTNK